MKNIKNLLFLSFLCSLVLFTNCVDSNDPIVGDDPVVGESLPPFYLDDNGITIKAKDGVTAGTTGELDGVTYTAVDNTTLKSMADNSKDLTKVVTSLVTNMTYLFDRKETFNQDIGSWDVSNVTDMSGMFDKARSFNQDISS